MWYVYILKSLKTKKYYIGCSNDYKRRLDEHNSGYNKSTKNGSPWYQIYLEEYYVQGEAFAREKKVKSYKNGNAFKKLISVGGGVVNRSRL